jgi:dCTP deaminase
MPTEWNEVQIGTLSDENIKGLAESGELIVAHFDPERVRQACYELRASEVFWDVASAKENKRVTVGANGFVLRPHSFVTAIVMEKIVLPNNVLGRVLAKGQLFSLGILPVCTYADPGFNGRLGITLFNASHRYIAIKPEQPIAKIEFSLLPTAIARPYSGQHGFETEMWPIPLQHVVDQAELRKVGIDPLSISEIENSYGPALANVCRRFIYYERKVWLHIGITVVAFASLFALYGHLPMVISFLVGVATNLVTTLLIYLFAERK